MMDKQALAQEIYQISNICGEFTLRSGNKATEYFDKYLFEAQPKILSNIAQQLAFLIPFLSFELKNGITNHKLDLVAPRCSNLLFPPSRRIERDEGLSL